MDQRNQRCVYACKITKTAFMTLKQEKRPMCFGDIKMNYVGDRGGQTVNTVVCCGS